MASAAAADPVLRVVRARLMTIGAAPEGLAVRVRLVRRAAAWVARVLRVAAASAGLPAVAWAAVARAAALAAVRSAAAVALAGWAAAEAWAAAVAAAAERSCSILKTTHDKTAGTSLCQPFLREFCA